MSKKEPRSGTKSRAARRAANHSKGTDFQSLKSLLWEAANILRGSAVDRTDWKGYILPLLFFKRLSDCWDEETAEAAELYGDADPGHFEEIHRFQLPNGCHWDDVRDTAQNVGTALKHAMQEIERANPDTLYRVFGAADWANKEKFTDELIKDLIEGFSSISLGNNAVDTDILGDAYEYLVGKFADVNRRNKAGEFYTPRSVVRMMTEILDPKEGESIYDPACGTGGMLLAAIDHVKRKGGDPRTFFGKIYGESSSGSRPSRTSRTAPRSSPSIRSRTKAGRSTSLATSCHPSAKKYRRSPRPSTRSRRRSPKLVPPRTTSTPC